MTDILVGIFIGIALCLILSKNSRTKRYKKVLVNLFVAGRIKQIAESKDIDLGVEYEDFKLYNKKRRMRSQNLDESIETALQEELVADEEIFKKRLKSKKETKKE